MKDALHELWLLYRDRFTGWWLLSVCDCPEAALAYSEREMRDLRADPRDARMIRELEQLRKKS